MRAFVQYAAIIYAEGLDLGMEGKKVERKKTLGSTNERMNESENLRRTRAKTKDLMKKRRITRVPDR